MDTDNIYNADNTYNTSITASNGSADSIEGHELVNIPVLDTVKEIGLDNLDSEALDTYKNVKSGGLLISILDSNNKPEPCAYKSCRNNATFCMEELLVCISHAKKLLKCFVPEK